VYTNVKHGYGVLGGLTVTRVILDL